MPRPGREFEEAVMAFVKKLDPSAEVLFDHKTPDRDTGTPRQCDVWINAKFGGHYPISILVSCKDHNRKLNVSDIGTFHNEVESTGANMGVIYSKRGFTKPALQKAKVNSLLCCKLYQNEPPDIPTDIWIQSFTCFQRVYLVVLETIPNSDLKIWNDIFGIKIADSGRTILDNIAEIFHDYEHKAIKEAAQKIEFPSDWHVDIEFPMFSGERLMLHMDCVWKKYRSPIEASLVDGSYCLSNDSFSGTQISPSVDLAGTHPGDHWIEITDQSFKLPVKHMMLIPYGSDLTQLLREHLGSKLISII